MSTLRPVTRALHKRIIRSPGVGDSGLPIFGAARRLKVAFTSPAVFCVSLAFWMDLKIMTSPSFRGTLGFGLRGLESLATQLSTVDRL